MSDSEPPKCDNKNYVEAEWKHIPLLDTEFSAQQNPAFFVTKEQIERWHKNMDKNKTGTSIIYIGDKKKTLYRTHDKEDLYFHYKEDGSDGITYGGSGTAFLWVKAEFYSYSAKLDVNDSDSDSDSDCVGFILLKDEVKMLKVIIKKNCDTIDEYRCERNGHIDEIEKLEKEIGDRDQHIKQLEHSVAIYKGYVESGSSP